MQARVSPEELFPTELYLLLLVLASLILCNPVHGMAPSVVSSLQQLIKEVTSKFITLMQMDLRSTMDSKNKIQRIKIRI